MMISSSSSAAVSGSLLEELQFIDQQISKLDQELASLLSRHHDAVVHLAEIPGLGVDSAQQIIAEVLGQRRPQTQFAESSGGNRIL